MFVKDVLGRAGPPIGAFVSPAGRILSSGREQLLPWQLFDQRSGGSCSHLGREWKWTCKTSQHLAEAILVSQPFLLQWVVGCSHGEEKKGICVSVGLAGVGISLGSQQGMRSSSSAPCFGKEGEYGNRH